MQFQREILFRKKTDVCKIFGDIDIHDRYAEQYDQLLGMMQDILDHDGIDFDIRALEYNDEEDER